MEVVKQSLAALESTPDMRRLFLDKLSANGRGESDPANPNAPDAEENRRVVFKIRIKPDQAKSLSDAIQVTGLNSQEATRADGR